MYFIIIERMYDCHIGAQILWGLIHFCETFSIVPEHHHAHTLQSSSLLFNIFVRDFLIQGLRNSFINFSSYYKY